MTNNTRISGPVDVLAVMDDLHRGCRLYCDSEGRESRSNYANDLLESRSPEARAAVAELVDAGNAWCDLMPGLAGGPEFDRLTNALANIGSTK